MSTTTQIRKSEDVFKAVHRSVEALAEKFNFSVVIPQSKASNVNLSANVAAITHTPVLRNHELLLAFTPKTTVLVLAPLTQMPHSVNFPNLYLHHGTNFPIKLVKNTKLWNPMTVNATNKNVML